MQNRSWRDRAVLPWPKLVGQWGAMPGCAWPPCTPCKRDEAATPRLSHAERCCDPHVPVIAAGFILPPRISASLCASLLSFGRGGDGAGRLRRSRHTDGAARRRSASYKPSSSCALQVPDGGAVDAEYVCYVRTRLAPRLQESLQVASDTSATRSTWGRASAASSGCCASEFGYGGPLVLYDAGCEHLQRFAGLAAYRQWAPCLAEESGPPRAASGKPPWEWRCANPRQQRTRTRSRPTRAGRAAA